MQFPINLCGVLRGVLVGVLSEGIGTFYMGFQI